MPSHQQAYDTMTTTVYQLGTDLELTYSLPPERAVVCAYYQHQRHDYNTTAYDWTLAKATPSGRTIVCGDFVARA